MPPIYRNYCIDCDWEVTLEEYKREELAALAIEHASEYEHDINGQPMVERDHSPSTAHKHDNRPEQEPSSR